MTVLRASDHVNGSTKTSFNKFSVHGHGTKIRTAVLQHRVAIDCKKESRQRQHRRSNALLLGNVMIDETKHTDDNTAGDIFRSPSDQFLTNMLSLGLASYESCQAAELPQMVIDHNTAIPSEANQSNIPLRSISYMSAERQCDSPDFLVCQNPIIRRTESSCFTPSDSLGVLSDAFECDSRLDVLCRKLYSDHGVDVGRTATLDTNTIGTCTPNKRNCGEADRDFLGTKSARHVSFVEAATGDSSGDFSSPKLSPTLPEFDSKFLLEHVGPHATHEYNNNNLLMMMHHIQLHDVEQESSQATQTIMLMPSTVQSISCGL